MILEGDTDVISIIKAQKRALDSGHELPNVNILCIVDGGMMKGAYATGAGLALEELGYTNVFDTVVGISSGAPSGAYFVAGQVSEGSSLMYEECCDLRFMNRFRFWSPLNPKFIINAMRNGSKQIDTSRIFKNKTELLIGIANYETAKPKLVPIKTEEDLFLATEASISIPSLTNNHVVIDETLYTDGGFSNPHILEHTLNNIQATHILIFTSQDKNTADIPLFEKILNSTLLRYRYSKALRAAANNRRKARHNLVRAVLGTPRDSKICFVWGDGSIESTERNPAKIRFVIEKSRQWWLSVLN